MPTLLEKIEANARARLSLPTNRPAGLELAVFKRFLKVESHRLKMLHRGGAEGRLVCQGRAAVIDHLLVHLLANIQASRPALAKTPLPPLALVAIGGYGRRELNPQSDIDIMFLHEGDVATHGRHREGMTTLTEAMLLTLYDTGLKVGHSVRSVSDCVLVANSDMQSKTSLIEARLITGDLRLFEKMRYVVEEKCVQDHTEEYIAARLKDQATRRAKYGDSACMQEPNIKNGCGGLRDYQNLLWMAHFKYHVRSLVELEKREWISAPERLQLDAAYDFLLRARNELHYHAGRPIDVLLKGVQASIAHNLGYTDRSPVKRLEKFMRVLYTHMRHVYLITRALEDRLAFQQKPPPRRTLRDFFRRRPLPVIETVDGFQIIEGELRASSPRVFRDQPRRLMRAFLHAQQRRLKLNADLAQRIRHQLDLADRHFLKDTHVRETFLEILNQRGNVAPVMRAMHEVGLLGRFLPEFGKLTCLVQHEFFHRYTADEHTLICLEMLDSVWGAQSPPFQRFTEIFQRIERPFVLYLALLLHDSGKAAQTRKHAVDSTRFALRVAKRLGLDAPTTSSLLLLVEHHLSLIQISQKRDLEDPAVPRRFARQIQTLDNLNMLLLHTFADTLGTRSDLWTDFKESLVWTLYERAKQELQGQAVVQKVEEQQKETLAQAVVRLLPKPYSEEEFAAHFSGMPARYFQLRTAADIVTDLQLVHQFLQFQVGEGDHALDPAVAWQLDPDRGYATVRVCTWDRPGLFSQIAGSLTAADLNILVARIFSRSDGVIFDSFRVRDAKAGRLPSREAREKFQTILTEVLTGPFDLAAFLIARQKAVRPLPYVDGESMPTVIHFDNATSDAFTVIDIETGDRVGLLYTLSRTLSELHLDIASARIRTEMGAALDSFYVHQIGGGKVTDAPLLQAIEKRLHLAIQKMETPG